MKSILFLLSAFLCLMSHCSYGQVKTYHIKHCEIIQGVIPGYEAANRRTTTCQLGQRVIFDESRRKITIASDEADSKDLIFAMFIGPQKTSKYKVEYTCFTDDAKGKPIITTVTTDSFNRMIRFDLSFPNYTESHFAFQYK